MVHHNKFKSGQSVCGWIQDPEQPPHSRIDPSREVEPFGRDKISAGSLKLYPSSFQDFSVTITNRRLNYAERVVLFSSLSSSSFLIVAFKSFSNFLHCYFMLYSRNTPAARKIYIIKSNLNFTNDKVATL